MSAAALLTVREDLAAFLLGMSPDEFTATVADEVTQLAPGCYQITSLIEYAERRHAEQMRRLGDDLRRLSDALLGEGGDDA